MTTALFRQLYAASPRETLRFSAGTQTAIPALITVCSDEQTVMVGGILAKANFTARVLDADLEAAGIAPRAAVGKTLTYASAAYRVAQSKRHPASAVRTLMLAEK